MTCLVRPKVDRRAIRSGDHDALLIGLAALVHHWFVRCDASPYHPTSATAIAARGASPHAGMLAAAVDLRALLAESLRGRKALLDLGFKPFLEQIEGK
jgi:hypothetical protein